MKQQRREFKVYLWPGSRVCSSRTLYEKTKKTLHASKRKLVHIYVYACIRIERERERERESNRVIERDLMH